MPIRFGKVETFEGNDFHMFELRELEEFSPQFKSLLRKHNEYLEQRLSKMYDEVFARLEIPYRKDELTIDAIQDFKEHVMSTWKIWEIEEFYRFSVAHRFSENNEFTFLLVDELFADFSTMAALIGGALLYAGIVVPDGNPDVPKIWGGKIDAYRNIFGDMTYKEAIARLPAEKSELLLRMTNQILGQNLKGVLDNILDVVQTTKTVAEETKTAAERAAVGAVEITKMFNDLQPKLETPDLLSDLDPETKKADALQYMARLVNHIWCSLPDRKSKRRALDYVFEEAKDGDRCFADCAYARNLKARYRYNVSTVERRAAELHSKTTSSRWGTGMERPEDERKRAKKSLKAELKEINAEKRRRRP